MRDIASFLKKMRLRAGLTQTQAASGIMQKDSLSLIERGRQFPHPEHFLLLSERYGLTGYSLGDFFDQRTDRLLDLKNQILSAMHFSELGQLPGLLFSFRETYRNTDFENENRDIFSRQFFSFANAWFCYAEGGCPDDFLDECILCIRMTQPQFGNTFNVSKTFLVQNEIMIINAIACLCAKFSLTRQALILFEQLLSQSRYSVGSHPVQYYNLACLSHNAALLEWQIDPHLSEEHMARSLRFFARYGGAWSGCLAWRSQLQIRRKLHPREDQTAERWSLESCYKKFRPESMKHLPFKEFMEQQEYLELF